MRRFLQTVFAAGLLILSAQAIHAQQNKKEQIAKVLNDYFHLERENIHVHFDKNVFLTNEEIWFKGYVFHRKMNTPFFASVNIFASLIDEGGNILQTELLFGNLGNFSGSFKIDDNLKSGKYYLQFYTNWMNNFTEDESSVYEVTIINENGGIPPSLRGNNYAEVHININPEGGTLVQDVNNIVGISVLGCNNEPTHITEAEVLDNQGNIIKKVTLNKAGYGRFDILANQAYKISVNVNGTKQEQLLPTAQQKGVIAEINSYALADKTMIKIRTNKSTLDSFAGKSLYIVAHQDDKTSIFEISFKDNNLEQTIAIPNTDLFEGLNTIRILGTDLNEFAQRLIYIYPQNTVSTQLTKVNEADGQIEFSGKVSNPNMFLSLSVVPADTHSIKDSNDIYGGLLISPYIDNKNGITAKQYFNNITRGSKYELDLLLLNQKSKYNWFNITKNPPKSTYPFDIGLALKGTINQTLKSPKDYRVRVMSVASMIDETVKINEKNEFFLNNLILTDSTKLSFALMKDGKKMQDLKLYPQISNNIRKFNKSYKPEVVSCKTNGAIAGNDDEFELPKHTANSIQLEEIKVEGTASKLKHQKVFGNSQLRGYKISDNDNRGFFYILDLIRYHGFDVSTSGGSDVSITGRTVNTINGQRTEPLVYVDNMRVLDFSMLLNVQTEDVDELYINQHAIVPSVDNKMGIIRIYMKTDFSYREKNNPDITFMIKEGFEKILPFKNTEYISTFDDKGFKNFGLIDWQPIITTNEKGEFRFSIPKMYKGNVKVIIEGIGLDGKMISEEKTITL